MFLHVSSTIEALDRDMNRGMRRRKQKALIVVSFVFRFGRGFLVQDKEG